MISARTGVAATGVQYRRLDAGVERLIGAGVRYGSAPGEATRLREGSVVMVGGGNSAGQAALRLADDARRVTIVIRDTTSRAARFPTRRPHVSATDRSVAAGELSKTA